MNVLPAGLWVNCSGVRVYSSLKYVRKAEKAPFDLFCAFTREQDPVDANPPSFEKALTQDALLYYHRAIYTVSVHGLISSVIGEENFLFPSASRGLISEGRRRGTHAPLSLQPPKGRARLGSCRSALCPLPSPLYVSVCVFS